MAEIGEQYYYRHQPRLIFEVVEILVIDLRIAVRTIATHNPDRWPIGGTSTWTLSHDDLILLHPATPFSSCKCYWSQHPLYCTCPRTS